MPSSIISNIAALNAQANIGAASNKSSAAIARLSSGNRLTRASDDVAGLATGTALRTQVTTLRTALSNATQGASLLQVADGALSQIVDILQRQKAIATQASSGQLTDSNRALLNQEFQNLAAEIDRISSSTNFNGVTLLNGGLGTTTKQVNLDTLAAAAVTPGAAGSGQTAAAAGTAAASTVAVQAFNIQTGASLAGTAAAGTLDIADSGGTVLADAAYDSVNSAVVGQFTSFKLSNVIYAGSATIIASINGVEFTGTVADGATTALIRNGNTYLNLGVTAITLTDAGTTAVSEAQLSKDFENTVIQRTSLISGVNFAGTRLAGSVGAAAYGNATARLSSTNAVISNFRYTGNGGAADTSTLQVTVNGQTFVANTVKDAIGTAAGKIVFSSSDNQFITIDLTGLTRDFTNIRTNFDEQRDFINALNQGFSKAGGGLNFSIGSLLTDSIQVTLASASTSSIYGGQTLDVASAPTAQAASAVLDKAITNVTSLRASVGALQSRFNFASNAIQSTIENQDAARSSILDTDVSAESTNFSSAQVQLQAGISVLAQANQITQALLKLIQ